MKDFGGNILFLDRADINTDEIIPARYLTEISREALKPHLFEDLDIDGFAPVRDISGKTVVVTRDNFGCGSSREHAPWALEVNGLNAVIAPGFARIFRQNMFNCGLAAITISDEDCDCIFREFAGTKAQCLIDIDTKIITLRAGESVSAVHFSLSEFEEDLIRAGGWVQYADSHY